MIVRLFLAALLCVVCSSASYARPSIKHLDRQIVDQAPGCSDPVMRPCQGMRSEVVSFGEEITRKPLRHRRFLKDPTSKEITHHNTAQVQRRSAGGAGHAGARRAMPPGLTRVMAEGAGRAAGLIRSATGATAHVASRATGAFQCLVSALDRQGYPIRFMGGWRRHGSVRASLHPAGLALDINQYRRNVTKPRMPHNEIALANACGLISGAQWANGDSGHFQLGGWAGRHVAHRRHHHRHYASAP